MNVKKTKSSKKIVLKITMSMTNLCLKFEISTDDISRIRSGFVNWVWKFERYILSSHFPAKAPTDDKSGFTTSTNQRGYRA